MNNTKKTNPKLQIIGKYSLFGDYILGRGATSIVYKGEVSNSKQMVAIKVMDLSHNSDLAQRTLLQNECKALRELNHPNIIKLCQIIQIDRKFYIITKYYQGQTLADLLLYQSLSEEQISYIFSKVLQGIVYLINKNIIHRDLKPSNIIIDKDKTPIIIDFGFCQIIHQAKISRVFNVGSPSYMAPQAYLRTLYSEKSQSWSLGMILYQMLNRKTMDKGLPIKDFYQKVKVDGTYVSKQIENGVKQQLREIIEKSLKYNSVQRISITGMKYIIDLLVIKQKKEESKVSNSNSNIPSIIKFNHSKQIINFNLDSHSKNIKFQPPISPLKKRDVSIKFIKMEEVNHPAKSHQIPKPRIQPQNNITKQTKQENRVIPSSKNKDYFSNKIKKGVFDIKRLSQTQRQILNPHLNLNKHHQLSIKQL